MNTERCRVGSLVCLLLALIMPLGARALLGGSGMESPGRVNLEAGSYRVGEDLPEGLYTFYVSQGEEGGIEIGLPGYTHAYAPPGPALYSFFLPEGARVEFAGGVLRNLDGEMLFQEDRHEVPALRALVGDQVPLTSYTVSPLPGADWGRMTLYTREHDAEGDEREKEVFDLLPGESLEIRFEEWDQRIVEFENCLVRPHWGVG